MQAATQQIANDTIAQCKALEIDRSLCPINMEDLRRGFGHEDNVVDPLMEQMRSVLRLGPRASDASQHRARRFSDADRPEDGASASLRTTMVRSRDGTRWLPAPDEQSLRYGQRKTESAIEDHESIAKSGLIHHECASAVCAVARVFETTELLELIISFLETKDIIPLRLTSKQWNSTICESPQLRLHFFTYGQWARPGSQFQLLPLSVPGLAIELGHELHLGRWIKITFTPECARRISQNSNPTRRVRARSIFEGLRGGLGSRRRGSNDTWPATQSSPTINSTLQYEDLFVTQPPLLGMQAFIVFTDDEQEKENSFDPDSESPPAELLPCAKLSCDAGITLGFLAETAQSLLNSQPAGPSTAKDVRVVFKGIMSFCAAETAPKKRTRTRIVTPI